MQKRAIAEGKRVLVTTSPVSEVWTRIRALAEAEIWTDPMVSALVNGVKGSKWHALNDKVTAEKSLRCSWSRVFKNKGASGVDKVSVERFAAQADIYLQELAQDLGQGKYRPSDVRRVYIPKGNGKARPLGIPTVKDRIVQGALKLVLEPIFEKEFIPSSYGFRPGKGCKQALREVDQYLKEGYTYVVDADLKSYFDTIPHAELMQRVRERISDSRVLTLIESFLKQGIMEGLRRWTPTGGTPQGAVLSPLLANIYLDPLDKLIEGQGYKIIRYADDFVILCQSQGEAIRALENVKAWVAANGLELSPEKTHIGDCRIEGQGFEFLGYRFEAGKRVVRNKSLMALKDRIRGKTRRSEGKSLSQVIENLNPTLKGWFAYFKHAHKGSLDWIDGFIRRRMRAMLRRQQHQRGYGKNHNDHKRWPNAYFAAMGLFTMKEAQLAARRSR